MYAFASISGGDSLMPTHATHVDRDGDRNPAWNAGFHFPITANADTRCLALHVLLLSEAPFFGHRDVGEVFVPLGDFLAGAADGGEPRTVSYQVCRPMSGRAHGAIYFCYRFTDVKSDAVAAANATETKESKYVKYVHDSVKAMAPFTAYPQSQAALAYPPIVSYGAPYTAYPPQPPYGYASPPPPYGYNAAPPPAMYGYAAPPVAAPARQRGRMEMGLGLGFLDGGVGGMMLGDMVGEFEADAAYDAGFDGGLGF